MILLNLCFYFSLFVNLFSLYQFHYVFKEDSLLFLLLILLSLNLLGFRFNLRYNLSSFTNHFLQSSIILFLNFLSLALILSDSLPTYLLSLLLHFPFPLKSFLLFILRIQSSGLCFIYNRFWSTLRLLDWISWCKNKLFTQAWAPLFKSFISRYTFYLRLGFNICAALDHFSRL